MKCTFNHVHSTATKEKTVGSRVEGFIPLQTTWLPWKIHKWIIEYEGINATVFTNGIRVHSWAETTCLDTDNYDESVGVRLSESKAKKKVYTFMRTLSHMLLTTYVKLGEEAHEDYLKYSYCIDHENEYESILSGKPNN